MGLFNNFDRPGPGVRKDAERPKGMKLFFELFFRKIGSYIAINFFYLLSLIPAIAIIWHLFITIAVEFFSKSAGGVSVETDIYIVAAFWSLILSTIVCLVYGLSPFSSGFYYVLRNFSFEKHAFVFSDFWSNYRNNAKNSWIMFFVDLVAVVIALLFLRVYLIMSITNTFFMVPLVLLLLCLAIYSLMTPYKWTMLVTFDLTKKQIYKNSLFLVLGNAKITFRQFISTAFVILILMLLINFFTAIGLVVMFLIGLSVYGLVCQLNIYQPIQDLISQSPGGHDNIK